MTTDELREVKGQVKAPDAPDPDPQIKARYPFLTRRQQQIIHCVRHGEMTQERIAELLAVSVATVKRDYRAAIEEIAQNP